MEGTHRGRSNQNLTRRLSHMTCRLSLLQKHSLQFVIATPERLLLNIQSSITRDQCHKEPGTKQLSVLMPRGIFMFLQFISSGSGVYGTFLLKGIISGPI